MGTRKALESIRSRSVLTAVSWLCVRIALRAFW